MGNVAIQQALVIHFGLSYRKAATIMGVNHRTVWQHVQARPGSNVQAWSKRTAQDKRIAVSRARKLIDPAYSATAKYLRANTDMFERFTVDGRGGKVRWTHKPAAYPEDGIAWSKITGRYLYLWL